MVLCPDTYDREGVAQDGFRNAALTVPRLDVREGREIDDGGKERAIQRL